jgi:ABC-type multidrug transport system fused ATPase/permease subunit
MQHFKIINIHTNKVINLNYTELQDFMKINRKDFFYNYTIQRIQKTNILKNIIAFLIVSFGSIALLMLGGLLDKI